MLPTHASCTQSPNVISTQYAHKTTPNLPTPLTSHILPVPLSHSFHATRELRKNLIEDGHRDMINDFESTLKVRSPRRTPRQPERGRSPGRSARRTGGSKSPARSPSPGKTRSSTGPSSSRSPSPAPRSGKKAAAAKKAAAEEESDVEAEVEDKEGDVVSKVTPGSYAGIADQVSLSMFHWVWTGVFLMSMIVYVVAVVILEDEGNVGGGEKFMAAVKWAKVLSGQVPPALCCVMIYRKNWGAR